MTTDDRLTEADKESLETWNREGLYACPHTHHCPTPKVCSEKYGLHAAVESLLQTARAEAAAEALEQAGEELNATGWVEAYDFVRARAAEFRRAGQQQKEGQA